jgi:hypothetical protein
VFGVHEEELPPVEDDLPRFRRDPRIALSTWKNVYHEDPLRWWEEEGQKPHPRLAMMACDSFAIQGKEIFMAASFIANTSGTASPISVERVFFPAGNFQGANRQNISPTSI